VGSTRFSWGYAGLGIALALMLAAPAPTVAQTITMLTWNHPNYEARYREAISEFEAEHEGVTVEWLDKKGTEYATFFQTQLVAGTPPDVVQLQGMLWLEYADAGVIADLSPRMTEVEGRFEPGILDYWEYQGKQWVVPSQYGKTLLHYNRPMLAEAGIEGPPETLDELLEDARKLAGPDGARAGFLSLNFDWQYWPLFAIRGIDFLNEDMSEAAFNTAEAVELVGTLAELTREGVISATSWTGRWVEPNGEFAAGRAALYLTAYSAYGWFKAPAEWANPDTLGSAQFPDLWAVPVPQGWAISQSSEHQDLAWALIEHMTSKKWAMDYGRVHNLLSGNIEADRENIAHFEKEDPVSARILELNLEGLDSTTGAWKTPKDALLKEAFWPELQSALLGQKSPEDALDEAERKVNRALHRR
jgi:ABC-type glycerol-3-phosphate transport system substrate-binding protein